MEDPQQSPSTLEYELCTLIPQFHSSPSASSGKVSISCVQAIGQNIYLGCSNGSLQRYVLEESADGTFQYSLASEFMLSTRASIDSIQLAPTLSKAIVLSKDQIFFLSLPTLELIPPEVMRTIPQALGFAINETPAAQEPVRLIVLKRASIGFYDLGNKTRFLKEVRISSLAARQAGSSLCFADTENYNILNIATSSNLAVHPISIVETWKILPIVEVSKENEYLIVACTGTSDDHAKVYCMALFISGTGEPTRNPMELEQPDAICVDKELVISLHTVHSSTKDISIVQVRAIGESKTFQTIHPPPSGEDRVRLLSLARSGFAAPVNSRQDKLLMTTIPLFESLTTRKSLPRSSQDGKDGFEEPAGSGLTPPPTPTPSASNGSVRQRNHPRNRSNSRGQSVQPSSSSRALPSAHILLATSQAVHALLPSTLISQVEGLLNQGKVNDAAALLSKSYAKNAKNEALTSDFRYLNQRIGICYLHQTAFEAAGNAFFRGDMDPRWLIGLWTEWRELATRLSFGAAGDTSEPIHIEIFSGLEKELTTLKGLTIQQIVTNYSPHLGTPNALSTAGKELESTLRWSAREMLVKYLRKYRTKRSYLESPTGIYADKTINKIVDTVSVMLYASTEDSEELQELRLLVDESPFLDIEDVKDVLITNHHIASIARVYEKKNDRAALLDLYIKLADGILKDESISDPVERIKMLLASSNDWKSLQKHCLWLLKRDSESALGLLISSEAKRPRTSPEDILLLAQIHEVDPGSSLRFLEYLVLQKRIQEASLHTQLVFRHLDGILHDLEDPEVVKEQAKLGQEYASLVNDESEGSEPMSFPWYLAFKTQDSEHKKARLKLDMMLQGSTIYDLEAVQRKIRLTTREVKSLLSLEVAILEAKACNHKVALSILVNDLHDFVSAEAYCALGGGRVITPKLAAAIGDRLGLPEWAALVLDLDSSSGSATPGAVAVLRRHGSGHGSGANTPLQRQAGPEGAKAVELTKMLLEVYMGTGESRAKEASMLLNAQAANFSDEEMIPQMPDSWPLELVYSFVERSWRRSLHAGFEGQILKQLSAAENLQTSELFFEVSAAAGAMIEESTDATSPPDVTQSGGDEGVDEPNEPSTSYGARKEWASTEHKIPALGSKEKELPHPPSTDERTDIAT